MDFRATVNCDDWLVHCPTQNASQNNLSVPVSLQTLLSHTTDTSHCISRSTQCTKEQKTTSIELDCNLRA